MSIRVIDFLKDKSHLLGKTSFSDVEKAAFDAHGWWCHYCRTTQALTVDHVVPVSKGGRDVVSNLVPACRTCNSQKRGKDYDEFVEWRLSQVVAFETYGAMGGCL